MIGPTEFDTLAAAVRGANERVTTAREALAAAEKELQAAHAAASGAKSQLLRYVNDCAGVEASDYGVFSDSPFYPYLRAGQAADQVNAHRVMT